MLVGVLMRLPNDHRSRERKALYLDQSPMQFSADLVLSSVTNKSKDLRRLWSRNEHFYRSNCLSTSTT